MSAHTEHSFGGHALDRYLIDYETVADTPAAEASAPTGDESVAAVEAPDTTGAAEVTAPDAPPATPTIDWNAPEARQAFEQFQAEREQAAAQAAAEAEQQQARQGQFSQVEEGLALLGIDPNDFKAYMQQQVAPNLQPLEQAAQQYQAEQSMREITAHLDQLGTTHPDLLGDGVNKLSELTGEDGQPLFQPDQVKQQNQSAVISTTVDILEASKGPDGNPTIPWTVAAEHAAKTVAERDQIVAKAAVEQFKRQLAGTSTAPADITGGGTGGAARVTGVEGGDELAVANRWLRENS